MNGHLILLPFPLPRLCGSKKGAVAVPNLNLNISFVSDASKTNVGFDIGITWQKTSCHRVIELTEDDATGVIRSPRFPKKYKKDTVCEWWIKVSGLAHFPFA